MLVRVEAFSALEKIEMVSEDFLLQTLSKRVLEVGKKKEASGQNTTEQFKMLAASVAGAFVHGLEDEFFEVSFLETLVLHMHFTKLIRCMVYH